MQIQADLIGMNITRSEVLETTAMGAAYLAGLAIGFWKNLDEIKALPRKVTTFNFKISKDERDELYKGWVEKVNRILS